MGIIIKKPIGASRVYDELEIESKLLSNLKDQQQEGLKEGGSTNKYFTGLTGSLPGELGQVFNPDESNIKDLSGYVNASTYTKNDNSIQKPLGASDFYSSGSGGYSNVNGNAVPSSYEVLSDLTSNVISPNGNSQYGLDINKVYAAPPVSNPGPLSSIFESPIDFATYTTQQLEEASDNQRVGPNITHFSM